MNTIFSNIEFVNSLGSSDFESWINVQKAYRENAFSEEIFEVGFNTHTGYVYIALENGVQIASCFGQSVDYIVTDYDNGEEHFFDTYIEAYDKQESFNL
jgi:hypothetical protein